MKYSKNKKFIGKMFDEISPTYDRLNHLLSGYQDNRWRKSAVKYLAKLSADNKKILDLASGTGDLGAEFLKLTPERLFSVDLSEVMLKINRSKIQSENNIVVRADAEHLPFAGNYFDVCGIGFGVRNFQNLENCITSINRVLKTGGRFLTIEMFKPAKKTLATMSFRVYFEKVLPKIGNTLAGSKYAYDYLFESVDSFLTVKQYMELLEKCGFRPVKYNNNFLNIVHTVFAEKM
jgi:demethylmenaquinone methyltransferase / 2-methoxy-6-polyprenyl-1,4-benzoquinol methylase